MSATRSRLKISRGPEAFPEFTSPRTAQQPVNDHDCIIPAHDEPATPRPVETATSESVRREEFRRGIQEGKRLTEAALKAEYEERLEQERHRVDNVLAAFTEQLSSIQGAAEQAVIKFAFGIAEKIIRKEITEDRQIVVEQIKEGVRRVVGVENVRVRIHPEDLPLVRDQRPVIQGSGDAIREIVLDGDDSLERGDCIIESDMGNIDARVATQLRQIEMVLFEGRLRS